MFCCAAPDSGNDAPLVAETQVAKTVEEPQPEELEPEPVVEEPSPPEPRGPFMCLVENQETWGISVEPWSDFLEVTDIKGAGRICDYNTKQGEENKEARPGSSHRIICVDDVITKVGEALTGKDMLKALQDKSLTQVTLNVSPPIRKLLTITRASAQPWGIAVAGSGNAKGLLVLEPAKEASAAYLCNKEKANEEDMLQARDMIVKINEQLDSAGMLAVLKDTSVLALVLEVLRPMKALESA